jgi:hypothetical protein
MAVYKPRYKKDGKYVETKTYWMEFVMNGERVRKSTGEKNLRKAEAFEDAYKTQLRLGKIGLQPEIKEEKKAAPVFADAMREFLEWSATRHNIAPSTTHRYKVASVSLVDYFVCKKVDSIADVDIN